VEWSSSQNVQFVVSFEQFWLTTKARELSYDLLRCNDSKPRNSLDQSTFRRFYLRTVDNQSVGALTRNEFDVISGSVVF